VKVLITGADGFVGSWLTRRLVADGHVVVGTFRPGEDHRPARFTAAERERVTWVPLELADDESVRRVAEGAWDAVAHLAAVSWATIAERSPGRAWNETAGGTARFMRALAEAKRAGDADPLVLVISSVEVYGPGPAVPRKETEPPAPISSYAASKLGAELAALMEWRRAGLRVVIARPSPHTGRGQSERGLIPKYARRVLMARRVRAPAIATGLLDGVRDFLHVTDVVEAYLRLLTDAAPGEIYNVSSGEPVGLKDIVLRLCALSGWQPILEVDAADIRADVVPWLVGDSTKLRETLGWAPRRSLDQTLQDVLDAQTS
jgi:GDP-4-dehydro-6-deoxy-D-mannose reductase